jgi:hypothetical protein
MVVAVDLDRYDPRTTANPLLKSAPPGWPLTALSHQSPIANQAHWFTPNKEGSPPLTTGAGGMHRQAIAVYSFTDRADKLCELSITLGKTRQRGRDLRVHFLIKHVYFLTKVQFLIAVNMAGMRIYHARRSSSRSRKMIPGACQ